jgi:hypothetical protein
MLFSGLSAAGKRIALLHDLIKDPCSYRVLNILKVFQDRRVQLAVSLDDDITNIRIGLKIFCRNIDSP